MTLYPYQWDGTYSAYSHWLNIALKGTIECIVGGTFRIGLPNKTASPNIILCEYTLTAGDIQSVSSSTTYRTDE